MHINNSPIDKFKLAVKTRCTLLVTIYFKIYTLMNIKSDYRSYALEDWVVGIRYVNIQHEREK